MHTRKARLQRYRTQLGRQFVRVYMRAVKISSNLMAELFCMDQRIGIRIFTRYAVMIPASIHE